MNRYRSILILLVVVSVFSFGCSKSNVDESEISDDSQNDSSLLTEIVTSNSEAFEIPDTDDFPGMTVIIPEGAFPRESSIDISYSSADDLDLNENLNILTPLIHIEIEENRLDKPMELKIPVIVPENHFALAFYYDFETGSLEAIPSVYEDDGMMRIMTTHFSEILVASIMQDLLVGPIETDFQVGRDNLQIPNIYTYLAPNGMCNGMAESTLYYFKALRPTFGYLYNLYDNNTLSTPGFWRDDRDSIYLNSVIQEDREMDTFALDEWLTSVWDRPSVDHFYMTAFAMLRSKSPQLVIITEDNQWDEHSFPTAHALIAYRTEGTRIYVADPNEPTNSNLYLEIDLKSGNLKPYIGSQSISDADVLYKYMYFVGDSALLNYDSISDSWTYLHDGTIADKNIPEYTFYEILYDFEGNEVPVEISSNHLTSEDTFRVLLEPDDFQSSLTAYGEDFSKYGTAGHDEILTIPLVDNETIIGLQVDTLFKDSTGSILKAWTDFKWINVKKTTPEKWESVATVSYISLSSGLTQEQIDQAIGVSTKEIIYFSYNPGLDVYNLYFPSSKVNRTMTRVGTQMWSDFTKSVDNVTISDSFVGVINEEENKIIGKSEVSNPEDGIIFELDLVMTKIDD
ncbi:MAG: hypothetical protein U9Q80_09735 [Bacillota bacterium]|nr:hypothetical protein [Bacillota bacterium]